LAERNINQVLVGIIVAVLLGGFVSWAGSHGGFRIGPVGVFAFCGALAFGINWLAFVPATLAQSEHYYDLVGGLTYITVTATAVSLSGKLDLRATIVAVMIIIWSVRLASFLFLRISRSGGDSRFDTIKKSPPRFFLAWTLQGLWVLLTASAGLAVITSSTRVSLGAIGVAGIGIWALGMLIETIADRQKSAFRNDSKNSGRFIKSGLWAWSRHPNYFGEILLWVGVLVVAIPVLKGWQWITVISPIFVFVLLTKVSGIPMLQAKADERWGGQEDYEQYIQNTPLLFPKPPIDNN